MTIEAQIDSSSLVSLASSPLTKWPARPLHEVAIKIQDGTHFSPKSMTGPYRYLTSKNIRFGYLTLTNCEWISQREHDVIFARCDVQFGDLLLTKDGANTGNAALNSLREPFSLLSSVAFIRCDKQQMNPSFLLQYLLSPIGQRRLKDLMSGNAITRLTLQKIKNFTVPTPPITEQYRIAEILDTIDTAIQQSEALIVKLKQMKTGLLHDLLTHGIDDNGQLRDPGAHSEQFKDSLLGGIPKPWKVVRAGDYLTTVEQGWSPDCESEPAKQDEWGVLKTTAVVWEGYQENENKRLPHFLNPRPILEVKAGDVLIDFIRNNDLGPKIPGNLCQKPYFG